MGEDLRARLRRLRREPASEAPSSPVELAPSANAHETEGAAGAAGAAGKPASAPPADILAAPAHAPKAASDAERLVADVAPTAASGRSAFERLKSRARVQAASRTDAAPAAVEVSSKLDNGPRRSSAAPEGPPRGELSWGPPARLAASGATCARTTRIPRDHVHGDAALARFFELDAARLAQVAKDERIAACDLSRALFLDTETTGLSGGAGTYVWLVGLGRFLGEAEGAFELWQGFLEHPAKERELLAETAARVAASSCLVTFFGKSFDRHRLEDKMRLHGVEPPFARVPHLDLYWPLRRAHRGKWADCRLKTLERELCGVRRVDDLPGSFAPAAWFDFLASRPHRLEGVFRHNADDILSLVSLAGRA
ncbi:MAG: hypothetical protein RL112_1865 [Planctomycetota bacterium]